jgi:hypothetical protein
MSDTISISTTNKSLFDDLSAQLKSLGYILTARETKKSEYIFDDSPKSVTVYTAMFSTEPCCGIVRQCEQEATYNESTKREKELSTKLVAKP